SVTASWVKRLWYTLVRTYRTRVPPCWSPSDRSAAMSYILDALRKVERERQRTRMPLLEELLDASATPRTRLWPWLLVGALLVNAVVLAVLLGPRSGAGKPERLSPPDVTAARPPAVTTAALVQEERPGPPAPPAAPGILAQQPAEKEVVPAPGPVKGSATKTP